MSFPASHLLSEKLRSRRHAALQLSLKSLTRLLGRRLAEFPFGTQIRLSSPLSDLW